MNLITEQIAAIDKILATYNMHNEFQTLEKVTKDIKDSIEIEFHEMLLKG